MIPLVDPMPIVYRGLHLGRSAANIPKDWNLMMSRALVNLMMSRALVLVAVKATFGASLPLGFLAAPHGVAALRGHAELRQVLERVWKAGGAPA